jgi:hypothetical protein
MDQIANPSKLASVRLDNKKDRSYAMRRSLFRRWLPRQRNIVSWVDESSLMCK